MLKLMVFELLLRVEITTVRLKRKSQRALKCLFATVLDEMSLQNA